MENIISVFQSDSQEVNEYYRNNPNFIIQYSQIDDPDAKRERKSYCAIYFSSHDIYYPNHPEAFKKQLVDRNRFEWYGTRIKKARKHIFVRDIKKQWYLNGINKELNSIEKVYEMLKVETKGYEVVTVGSSAGGYAAILFGQLLKARSIFSFNGQTQLYDLLETSNESKNPIVFRKKNDSSVNSYFSLKKYISSPENIFYFYSNKSDWDLIQYEHIKHLDMHFLGFKTSHHGIPFVKVSIPKVINLESEKLQSLAKENHSPIFFSVKLNGLKKVSLFLFKQIKRKLRNRY